MVVIGLWLGIIGYGVLYAGAQKLGGNPCSLTASFQGKCTGGGVKQTSTPGQTVGQSQASLLARQQAAVPHAPVLVA